MSCTTLLPSGFFSFLCFFLLVVALCSIKLSNSGQHVSLLLISTRVSSVSSAVFSLLVVSAVTHQLKGTWLNLSVAFFFLSSSFSPCLSCLPLFSSPCCYRMEQIRESIQCNHDKWGPVVSKFFFFFVHVCVLGQGCWEIPNESISCYRINKHCMMVDVWMNIWIYGWMGR